MPRTRLLAALCALALGLCGVLGGISRTPGGPSGGNAPNSADPPGKIPPQRQPELIDDVPPTLDEINELTAYDFDPQYGKQLDGFTLWLVDDLGRLIKEVPEYVRLEGRNMEFGAYHLVIYLREAPSISDLYFYVRYDQRQYHPRQIEPGSAFGFEGDRLWVQKMDIPGVATAGISRINPARNGGIRLENGVVAEVVLEKRPFDYKPVELTHAPVGEVNQARNIQAYIDDNRTGDRGELTAPSGDVVLYWEEANVGDYNNDGYVSMADLMPLSRRYGRRTVDAQEDAWDVMADGNNDTEVNYKDLIPLNRNYGAFISGYRVYRRPAGKPQQDEVRLPHRTMPILPLSVHRPKKWNPIAPVAYRYYDRDLPTSSSPQRYTYRIVPYDAVSDTEGEDSAIEATISVTSTEVELVSSGERRGSTRQR